MEANPTRHGPTHTLPIAQGESKQHRWTIPLDGKRFLVLRIFHNQHRPKISRITKVRIEIHKFAKGGFLNVLPDVARIISEKGKFRHFSKTWPCFGKFND